MSNLSTTRRADPRSEEEIMREWLTSENPDRRASAEAFFDGTRGADNPEDIGYEQHGTTSDGRPIWGADGGGPASEGGMVGSGIGATDAEILAQLARLRGEEVVSALGAPGEYGQPNDPMAYNDPRRGGNVPGMQYNRTAPPPMSRPQGRNTMLPQYGTDDFMPVGQGAPNHRPNTNFTVQAAPVPNPRAKPSERPRNQQHVPTLPHHSTYSMAQPRRTKPAGDPLPLLQNQPNSTTPRSASRALPAGSAPYQPSSVPGPQQAAPGTPGTGMSMPQQNPLMQSPEKIAQQQALAKMALSGGTTVKPPWMP